MLFKLAKLKHINLKITISLFFDIDAPVSKLRYVVEFVVVFGIMGFIKFL